MYLHYGAGWTSGESEAAVSITKESKLDENGDIVAIMETWGISGRIIGTSLADLQTKMDALDAAFADSGEDIWLSTDQPGTTVAQEMRTINSVPQNIITSPVAYPKGNENELVNVRTYTVSVTGEVQLYEDVGGVLSENIKYNWTHTNQKWSRVTDGSFTVANDSDALTAFNSFLAANPVPAGYHREPYSYDEDGSSVAFRITDTEYWKQLPSNVSSGGYTIKTNSDGESQVHTITGSFTGSGAEAAAIAAVNAKSGITISKDLTEDEYTGTWSFTYVRQDTAYNDGIISETETITITRGGADFHLHEQQEGEAVRAETVQQRTWTATQSGSKTGVGGYPAPNPPKWTTDNNGKNPLKPGGQDTYVTPKQAVGGKINYTRSWSYTFGASRNIFAL